ncbi:MAG: carboxypeptidase-like regulatory domain-containing protein, partial [Prevotella sp.]|nr:carboxypeptidase-like regulatory domain-containing protein [Prevotella sp.]
MKTMRLAVLMIAMMMTVMSFAKTQDVFGRVINQDGEPMPFVNVVLLALSDSSFVQGAMTNEQGEFRVVTTVDHGVLKITSIGYETQYVDLLANTGTDASALTITLKEDSQVLGEVVVRGQLPRTHVKGDAMRTTVAGTILEHAGTVSDALSKIPMLDAERDGSVKVLGRGDAEVYINGRRVQDMSELSRLRSEQIQHVEVVQNPGARYAASVKAVVRITLKKAQGEGISFQDNAGGIYQYGHTLTNNLDVNYRTGGLDVTASFWAGRYGHGKSLQENDLTYYVGPDFYLGRSNQESTNVWKGWSPQLQVNYMLNE